MNKENKNNQLVSALRVQTDSPKKRGGAHPVQTRHQLYSNWKSLRIDGRTWYAKRKTELVKSLLEPFKEPIPRPAKILANLTATNILIALRVEGFFHTGREVPSNTLRDYVTLANSNSANLQRLFEMAKNGNSNPNIPGLEEYLRSCGAKMLEGEKRTEK